MKCLLLPVDQSDLMPSALATARLLAEPFASIVEGVALRPAFAEVVAPDPIVAVSIPPNDWDEEHFCSVARSLFDGFARDHATSGGAGPSYRWRGGRAIEDGALGSMGRVFDATVMGRPGARGTRMTAFESALFDSGKPLMMAPPRAPKVLGENVIIHWNQSTETASAIALAMPLLRRAKRVLVLTVEGNAVPGPLARDAAGHLVANGVPATDKTVHPKGRGPGETILAEAAAFGADLLVKGAYTQSRLRQMIFGGATSHILGAAEIPVFFAH